MRLPNLSPGISRTRMIIAAAPRAGAFSAISCSSEHETSPACAGVACDEQHTCTSPCTCPANSMGGRERTCKPG